MVTPVSRKERRTMIATAREVTAAMRQVNSGISAVATSAGKLMALMDNVDDVQTLSSVRSDTAYQLIGNLHEAYTALADFLAKEAWD